MLYSTEDDLRYCYRLFLERDPDRAGFDNFAKAIEGGTFPVSQLVSLFLKCPEYAAGAAARARRAQRIEEVVLRNGLRMKLAPEWNRINQEIVQNREWEPHVAANIARYLRPGSVFVDIGANVGYFSLFAAKAGARVWAYEPNVRNLWLLKSNAEVNALDIKIMPFALADTERLVAYNPLYGNGAISELDEGIPIEGQEVVRTTTLDAAMNGTTVDVIKIDVEGAEAMVLRGARAVLAARPVVFSEYSPGGIEALSRVRGVDYLCMFDGYRLAAIRADGSLKTMSAQALDDDARRSATGFIDIVAMP